MNGGARRCARVTVALPRRSGFRSARALAILRALMRSGSPRTDGWQGIGIAWSITSTLLASFLVLGGLGYVGDRVLDTGKVLTGIGFVLGAGFGVYTVYLQYGKLDSDDG